MPVFIHEVREEKPFVLLVCFVEAFGFLDFWIPGFRPVPE